MKKKILYSKKLKLAYINIASVIKINLIEQISNIKHFITDHRIYKNLFKRNASDNLFKKFRQKFLQLINVIHIDIIILCCRTLGTIHS